MFMAVTPLIQTYGRSVNLAMMSKSSAAGDGDGDGAGAGAGAGAADCRVGIEPADRLAARRHVQGVAALLRRHQCDRRVESHGSEARTKAVSPQAIDRFLAWLELQTPQRRTIGMAAEYASLAGSRRPDLHKNKETTAVCTTGIWLSGAMPFANIPTMGIKSKTR
ncbi:hypothetical protein [Comamonas faecalis]